MEPNEDKTVEPLEASEITSGNGSSVDSNAFDEVEELRRIIVGPEQVSVVLPEAVSNSARSDDRLSDATLPLVERNIRESVLRNPKILADALFPVIGPAIRKAISTALSSMVQSFNQTLEYSVSPQGLKWRLEAARTGRSFGEVVMLKTLQYRVEQVFLIHRETGLLLQHVSIDPDDVEDADMVGAMLTAITDFAQDSFEDVDSNATLDSFKISGLQVWVENSPDLILAGVIRGNPPVELRETFFSAAEFIQSEFRKELRSYEGNSDAFERARPKLEECLKSRSSLEDKKSGVLSPANITLGVLGLLTLLVLGYFAWDYWKWSSMLDDFRGEPGYVLTDYERGWFSHTVSGLKDPLAADHRPIVSRNRYDEDDVSFSWKEYQDSAESFVLRRAEKLLKPPKGVTLKVEGTKLVMSGTANSDWIVEAKRIAPVIAGIDEFDVDIDEAALIQKTNVNFKCGTVEVLENSRIERVSEWLKSLAKEKAVTLSVTGYASSSGETEINDELSLKRAELVSEKIKATISDDSLSENVTIESKGSGNYQGCKVTFEIDPK